MSRSRYSRTYAIATAVLSRYYGRAPTRKYFVGCSGGGRQGMMFAERYTGNGSLEDGANFTCVAVAGGVPARSPLGRAF